MADADKEKAEKVAAARKRYEELKKKKAKKEKKKDDKTTSTVEADDVEEDVDAAVTKDNDDTPVAPDVSANTKEEKTEEADASDSKAPDLSLASRMRSESFKRNSNGPSSPLKSPSAPGTDSLEGASLSDATHEVYKKQAARIESLEREVKKLSSDLEVRDRSLKKAEAELDEIRDGHADVAQLKQRAEEGDKSKDEVEKLKTEIASLQRQAAQLEVQHRRTSSFSTTPTNNATSTESNDLSAQLSAKTNTIDSLTLELSNLRHETNTRIESLEASLAAAESATRAAEAERDAAAAQASASSDVSKTPAATSAEPVSDNSKTDTSLHSELAAAQSASAAAAARAAALEKKIEALTALHRDADARNATQLASRTKDADRARREAAELRARLRELSSENARMRGGGAGGEDSLAADLGEMDDVDLNERGLLERRESGNLLGRGAEQAYGALTNVFNAFAGGGNPTPSARRRSSARAKGRPSLDAGTDDGLQDFDDDEFDESAFRAAQEEEAKKRLERVREAKRKLNDWRGWRVDMVEVRGGVQAGIFDV